MTITITPSSGSGGTTCDGRLTVNAAATDWDSLLASTVAVNVAEANGAIAMGPGTYQHTDAGVMVFNFDLSGISNITQVVFGFSVLASSASDGEVLNLVLREMTAASTGNLASSDFNVSKFGSVDFMSPVDCDGGLTVQRYSWTLNAAGLAYCVARAAAHEVASFVLGYQAHIDEEMTGQLEMSMFDVSVDGAFADHATVANRPTLEITGTQSSGSNNQMFKRNCLLK